MHRCPKHHAMKLHHIVTVATIANLALQLTLSASCASDKPGTKNDQKSKQKTIKKTKCLRPGPDLPPLTMHEDYPDLPLKVLVDRMKEKIIFRKSRQHGCREIRKINYECVSEPFLEMTVKNGRELCSWRATDINLDMWTKEHNPQDDLFLGVHNERFKACAEKINGIIDDSSVCYQTSFSLLHCPRKGRATAKCYTPGPSLPPELEPAENPPGRGPSNSSVIFDPLREEGCRKISALQSSCDLRGERSGTRSLLEFRQRCRDHALRTLDSWQQAPDESSTSQSPTHIRVHHERASRCKSDGDRICYRAELSGLYCGDSYVDSE